MKNKSTLYEIAIVSSLIVIIAILLLIKIDVAHDDESLKPDPFKGKVLEIISEEEIESDGLGEGTKMTVQNISVEIKDGSHKGEIIEVQNLIDEMYAYNIYVDKGVNVMLYLDEDENGDIIEAAITDIQRDNHLLFLVIVFALLILIVGGYKGLKSILTLAITGLFVLKVFLPLTLKGYNPVILSVLICLAVIIITLIAVSGINRKTLSAIIGTSGGVIIAGVLTLIIADSARLTGLANEEAQMLKYIPQAIDFNFKGILSAGIILGALGAVMDVAMSIASSMNEIYLANPVIKTKELFKAGMNVGRDVMGTMSNTLILAYAGGAIQLMLLFMAYDIPLAHIINTDQVSSEIVRALAGSIGLIFSIPITAFVSATIGRDNISEI